MLNNQVNHLLENTHRQISSSPQAIRRSLSNEQRGLIDWSCPMCNLAEVRMRDNGSTTIVTEHITSQNKLTNHINLCQSYNDHRNLPQFMQQLADKGISRCICGVWHNDREVHLHENCHASSAVSNCDDSDSDLADADDGPATLITEPSSPVISPVDCQYVYRLYTLALTTVVAGTPTSGIAGLLTLLHDGDEYEAARWTCNHRNLTVRSAAELGRRYALEQALLYGAAKVTLILCDPQLQGKDSVATNHQGLIDQFDSLSYDFSGNYDICIVANRLAEQSMTSVTTCALNVTVNKSYLPPDTEWKSIERLYNCSVDEELEDELLNGHGAVDNQLNILHDNSVSSPPPPDRFEHHIPVPPAPMKPESVEDLKLASEICERWSEWIANQGPSLDYVPRDCIELFTFKARQLLQIYYDTSLSLAQRATALCHYMALPKMVLPRQNIRGGRSGRTQRAASIVVKARMEATADLSDVPPSGDRPASRTRASASKQQHEQRAPFIHRSSKLLDRGHVGRSARALTNMCPIGDLSDPVVRKEMELKHPHHTLTDDVKELMALAHESEVEKLNPMSFKRLLNKMDNGAAAGYDGWNANIIKSITKDSESMALHIRLLSDISNGRLPAPFARMIQRGRLVALNKQPAHTDCEGNPVPGSHRPIMISTCLYRLAARIVSDSVLWIAGEKLSPMQLGVGIPGALEAVIHSIN